MPGARVVHRIVGGDAAGWELQGDANSWVDPWQPGDEHVLGRVVAHLPGLGLTPLLLDPVLWLSLVVLGAGILMWPGRDDATGPSSPGPRRTRRARLARRRARRRRWVSTLVAATTVLTLVAVTLPEPATAARVDLADASLAAWTQTVEVPTPQLPAATCTTTDPELPCTAEVQVLDSWAGGYNLRLHVRDARQNGSTVKVPWTVTLNFATAPFPWVPRSVDAEGLVAHTTCADLPVLVVSGSTDRYEEHLLGPGETRQRWLQGHDRSTGTLLGCG